MDEKELIRKNDLLQRELARLVRPDGTLLPQDIVEAAEKPAHPLHQCFEWDDTEAARSYRLLQAKAMIRYVRVIVPTPEHRTIIVRMFASLPTDRFSKAGYRTIQSILTDEEKKMELILSALKELEAFRRRYEHICELAGVLGEIERITQGLQKKLRVKPKKKSTRTPRKALAPRRKRPGDRTLPKH